MHIIITHTAKVLDIDVKDIIGECRDRLLVDARRIITYYLKKEGWGWIKIGKSLKRNHSTIINLHKKHEELLFTKEEPYMTRFNLVKKSLITSGDAIYNINKAIAELVKQQLTVEDQLSLINLRVERLMALKDAIRTVNPNKLVNVDKLADFPELFDL